MKVTSGGVRCPFDVADGATQVEGHDGAVDVLVPHLDCPISTARNEYSRMISVPFNSIYSQVMTFISLKILPRVSFRAQVDFSFFSTNKEQMILEMIEVKAHTTS